MVTNNFNISFGFGKTGEAAVASLFASNGFSVTDLTDNPEYFHRGDIKASKDSQDLYIEVKTDAAAATTGNLVIELITNMANKTDGWFKTSTADKYAFYLAQTDEVILIDANELRTNYKQALHRIITTQELTPDNYYKQSVIGLLSIKHLKNLSSFRRIKLTEDYI